MRPAYTEIALTVAVWLERTYAPGSGGLWLALTTVCDGIGVEHTRQRYDKGAICLQGPGGRPALSAED